MIDYVEAPGEGAAIVMELVEGVSLHEMITRNGAASPEAALVVLKGSLLGLTAAHAAGIVHRDYKPENVLVDASGESKLTDFGVAVRVGLPTVASGTPLYMAPEQWAGAPATPATDIYAATAVFFECLTGMTPFSGSLGQLRQQHEQAEVPVGLTDAPLRELIARGMAKDPAARPANAADFTAELELTAARAYGQDWEARGRTQLAQRAIALLAALLSGGTATVGVGAGTAVTSTVLAASGAAGVAAAVLRPAGVKATAVKIAGLSGWKLGVAAIGVAAVTAGAATGGVVLARSPAPPGGGAASPGPAGSGAGQGSPGGTSPASPSLAATASGPTSPASGSLPPAAVTVCTDLADGCAGVPVPQLASEPKQFVLSLDGARTVDKLTWTNWGSPRATGSGTLEVDNCTPNCAQGSYTGYPSTVTLTGLKPYGTGKEAYSVIVIQTSEPNGDETFSTGTVP
jgi:serine/threonine-protein kinase